MPCDKKDCTCGADLLISKGVPQEVINESKNKMRAINSAWTQIQKLKTN